MPRNSGKKKQQSLWATAEKKIGKPVGDIEMDDLLALPLYTQTLNGTVLSGQIDARICRIIQEQIHSLNTPYKTTSDFVRDALYTFTLICQKKYFDGEKASEWHRLFELQRNKTLLQLRNQIREEASEFAREVLKMAKDSQDEASRSVERQLLILVGHDDHAERMYLSALKNERVHYTLHEYLGDKALKLIEGAK